MNKSQQQGPADIQAHTRLAVLANATADAKALMERGEHETNNGALSRMADGQVDEIIATWPEAAKIGVKQMVLQYGQPNEGTPTKLMWFDRAPWKRIQLTSDQVLHRFPTPHADFLTQYIDYEVPLNKLDELGRFTGSCLIDRASGEVAARCDSEGANFLSINLMHEIVSGTRTVDDARAFYSETLSAYCLGESAPHCERFLFQLPGGGSGDPDKAVTPGPKAKEVTKKVEEFLSMSGSPEHARVPSQAWTRGAPCTKRSVRVYRREIQMKEPVDDSRLVPAAHSSNCERPSSDSLTQSKRSSITEKRCFVRFNQRRSEGPKVGRPHPPGYPARGPRFALCRGPA